MKSYVKFALIGVALMISACITSLQPYYTEDDVIFDAALLGAWGEIEGNESWEFSSLDPELRSYRLVHTDSRGRAEFRVVLFQIANLKFLDFVPEPATRNELHVMHTPPQHFVALVESMAPTLRLAFLNGKGLDKNDGDFPARVFQGEHKEERRIILTAPTEDLQRFLVGAATTRRSSGFGSALDLMPREAID